MASEDIVGMPTIIRLGRTGSRHVICLGFMSVEYCNVTRS